MITFTYIKLVFLTKNNQIQYFNHVIRCLRQNYAKMGKKKNNNTKRDFNQKRKLEKNIDEY